MNLPEVLQRVPQLDRWIRLADGTVEVRTGKVEIGQGIKTALAMIAAEELDVALERIRIQTADTELTPNEWVTAGSMSVEASGSAIRIASARARELLLARAAERLGVEIDSLVVADGRISSPSTVADNEQTDYWSLIDESGFGVEIVDWPKLKDPLGYRTVGHRARRLDLPAKVRGDAAYVHDLTRPGLWHGRLVKPPVAGARLLECPDDLGMAGVEVVRDGSFVGVVASREHRAVVAAARLAARCRWQAPALEPLPAGIPDYLRNSVTASLPVVDGTPREEAVVEQEMPASAVTVLEASYYRPYQLHGSIGPSAALASFTDRRLTLWSHSQGVELLKLALAHALELAPENVRVIHLEGAGCYGHNGADDVALDAALLAMAVAPRPVRVIWSRADEHGFEPVTPAALLDLRAGLDASGRVVAWRHETRSFSHNGRPRPSDGYSNLQSAGWREKPIAPVPRRPALMAEVGIHRNLQPIYAFPRQSLIKHFVADSPLRTSSLRSLGAFANVFAIESFMDELAFAAGADPIDFRLGHLEDPRARAVLEALRQRAPARPHGSGRGVALARYKNRQTWCAVLVDLEVSDDAQVRLEQALIVADAGLVVDPDGLANQLEGGFVQAASMALKEAVTWDQAGVTSRDWLTYPILRFTEIPEIDTHLLDRPTERALGAGEASTGPTPAAIANAIFSATGIRVRTIPFTPAQLRSAAAS